MKTKMQRITFTLPKQLEEKLLKLKIEKGYTVSDLVRQGLELIFEKYGERK